MHSFILTLRTALFGCVLAAAGTAQAAVLTFDDLLDNPFSSLNIPDGYGGLNWDNMSVASKNRPSFDPSSGYVNGAVSGDYTAFNSRGTLAITSAATVNFNFEGAFFTGAWNEGLNIQLTGYRDGSEVYDSTVVVGPTGPTFFALNFMNIDRLEFNSFGGVDVVPGGGGTQFVMDNFTYSVVPIPAAVWLFGSGLGLLGWMRRRSLRAAI